MDNLLGERQMKFYLPVVVLRLRSQALAGGAAGLRVNSQLPLALNSFIGSARRIHDAPDIHNNAIRFLLDAGIRRKAV